MRLIAAVPSEGTRVAPSDGPPKTPLSDYLVVGSSCTPRTATGNEIRRLRLGWLSDEFWNGRTSVASVLIKNKELMPCAR